MSDKPPKIRKTEEPYDQTLVKHLTKGDPCPPLASGTLRIYSMKFCPYADRTRLVLHAKNIPHETVNVNTWIKPEWFFDKNPSALVPVLEKDDKIIYESFITSDYLDELYPDQRPLHSKDAYQKANDKMVLQYFNDKVNGAFWKAAGKRGQDPELKEKFLTEIEKLEEELEQRGTNFFGGAELPGMLDYMIWPFFARLRNHFVLGGNDLPDSLPVLQAWKARMLEDPSVKSILLPEKAYIEWHTNYRTPTTMFDEIEC
ncbi:glutathione S-transferase omega-1-like [Amphiura filiformis]|uniref:glutathione S-transferase omega-1-like n=1 Tax=Amphiura filiformis TaxID=82378 RepID=UPI003B20EA7B